MFFTTTFEKKWRWLAHPRAACLGAAMGLLGSLACSGSDSSPDTSSGGGSAGTSGNAGNPPQPAPTITDLADDPVEEAAWTILIYGHGDHNLSNSLLVDLREMAAAQLGNDVRVVVLTDWDSTQVVAESDPPQNFPDGIQLFQIPGAGNEPVLLAEGEEANLDDPLVLATLVRDVFAALPARRRGLILWDHGGAWMGGFGGDLQNGSAQNLSPMGGELVAAAISEGLSAAGISAFPPLDFMAFDTCLMAGAEIAYAFRDLADVFIADAEIDYGAGWNYEQTLSFIAANPDAAIEDLAAAEVSHWDAHHAGATANDDLLRSHVALDLSRMEPVAQATAQLTAALTQSVTFDPIELGRSSFFSLAPYASEFDTGASRLPGLRDMGQLLTALAGTQSDPAVALAAQTVLQELDPMVLARSQGSLREASGQLGFHVENTLGGLVTAQLLNDYGEAASGWVAASGWHQVLALAGQSAVLAPPLFDRLVVNGEAASRAAPPALQFQSNDPTVAKGAVYIAAGTDTGALILGLSGAGLVDPGFVTEFAWDGTMVTFADGQPAMLDIWLDTGAAAAAPILSIPGVLDVGDGEQYGMTLVFPASETTAVDAVISQGELATVLGTSEIAAAFPGASFTPLYVSIEAGAPEPSLVFGSPMPVPAAGFALASDYVPAGEYAFITTLTGVWGNEATEVDVVTLSEPLGP